MWGFLFYKSRLKKIFHMSSEGKRRLGCGKIISTDEKFKISAQHVVAQNHNNWYKLLKVKVVK